MRHLGSFRFAATALSFSWILLVLTPPSIWADDYEVILDPELDQIGSQIETLQVFTQGSTDWMTFGIYDTGASVVSVSYLDQYYFDFFEYPAIQIKSGADPASAQGIGGSVTGFVSAPGTISADGLHAFNIGYAPNGDLILDFDTSTMVNVPNVQAFLGADPGSIDLPTITGTPIHSSNKAAKIDMQGYQIDFGEGLMINLPDVQFLNHADAQLTGTPMRIPLQLIGHDNYDNPVNDVTSVKNPVQNSVTLRQGLHPDGTYDTSVTRKTFLFDTGAQISIISTQLAEDLGLDPSTSTIFIDVQGAAGNPIHLPGLIIDALELPRDDDGPSDGVIDGTLKLSQVPVFVLDELSDFGLDGILGMNLWNKVDQMLYDPTDLNDPYLSLTFSNNRIDQLTPGQMDELNLLTELIESDLLPAIFGGLINNLTTVHIPDMPATVPEPSAWILLTMGMTGLLFHGLREKLRNRRH